MEGRINPDAMADSMPEDEVRRLVQGWLTTEHLVVDCANRNTSLKGLRVQKRLEPV